MSAARRTAVLVVLTTAVFGGSVLASPPSEGSARLGDQLQPATASSADRAVDFLAAGGNLALTVHPSVRRILAANRSAG